MFTRQMHEELVRERLDHEELEERERLKLQSLIEAAQVVVKVMVLIRAKELHAIAVAERRERGEGGDC
jgi:hypothetical protein